MPIQPGRFSGRQRLSTMRLLAVAWPANDYGWPECVALPNLLPNGKPSAASYAIIHFPLMRLSQMTPPDAFSVSPQPRGCSPIFRSGYSASLPKPTCSAVSAMTNLRCLITSLFVKNLPEKRTVLTPVFRFHPDTLSEHIFPGVMCGKIRCCMMIHGVRFT